MNTFLESKKNLLLDRADMFAQVRNFFSERSVLEVDCPAWNPYPQLDPHIVPMQAEKGFLHTSPEYNMKQLLAEGSGDIYQMSHVFRKEESGSQHRPEFTMIEWYRLGVSFEEFLIEVLDLIQLFLGKISNKMLSYQESFLTFLNIDPHTVSDEELEVLASKHGLSTSCDRDTYLNYLLAQCIEPHLKELTIIYDFPASQAALAQTKMHQDVEVSMRFEIYFRSMEIANGYYELRDPKILKKRLKKESEENNLPLDPDFIAAHEKGLPDCWGVSLGFDRLMMLRRKSSSIKDVLALDR